MKRRLRENRLSAVTLTVFIACLVAQTWTGLLHYNDERRQHGESALALPEYLRSGHFWESTAENWESEFLQMAAVRRSPSRSTRLIRRPGRIDPSDVTDAESVLIRH